MVSELELERRAIINEGREIARSRSRKAKVIKPVKKGKKRNGSPFDFGFGDPFGNPFKDL